MERLWKRINTQIESFDKKRLKVEIHSLHTSTRIKKPNVDARSCFYLAGFQSPWLLVLYTGFYRHNFSRSRLFGFRRSSCKPGYWPLSSDPHWLSWKQCTIHEPYEPALYSLHIPLTNNNEYLLCCSPLHIGTWLLLTLCNFLIIGVSVSPPFNTRTAWTCTIIRHDYFCTNFVCLRQHPPGISAHQCYYSTN